MRLRPLLPVALAVLATGCGSGDEATTTGPAPRATQVVTGTGFRAALPATWTDVADQFDEREGGVVLAFSDPQATGFKPSVLVIRERSASLRGKTIAEVDEERRPSPGPTQNVNVTPPEPTELGGEPAIATTATGYQSGRDLAKRQIIALRGGVLYTVILTSTESDPRAPAIMRDAVRSWRWTG